MSDTTLLFATYLPTVDYKVYQYVVEYIERHTGIPTILLNGEALDDFALGYVDAGFITPNDCTTLFQQTPGSIEHIATPVLHQRALDPLEEQSDQYKIIVRNESSCITVADLQESVFSYCFRGHSCSKDAPLYQALEHTLLTCSTCPLALSIKDTVEACSHIQALRMVLHNEADAAILDARVFELILRNNLPMMAGLRELRAETLSKKAEVVVATHLDGQTKHRVREAFRCIHRDPFFRQRLQESAITRFYVSEPEDTLRELASTAPCEKEKANEPGIYDLEEIYAY